MGNCGSTDDKQARQLQARVPAKGTGQQQHEQGGATQQAGGGDPGAADSKSVLARWEDVREHYVFDKILGRGQFGVTRLVMHRETRGRAACKSISKRKCAGRLQPWALIERAR
jgi:hypothetical protein